MKNAENPEYARYILQTPYGYLTYTGTTPDISDKSIIIMPYTALEPVISSNEEKIKKFLERSTVSNIPIEECELLGYVCHSGPYSCTICGKLNHCKFWVNRSTHILFKVP